MNEMYKPGSIPPVNQIKESMMKEYKKMSDHIRVKHVPKNWTGYDNPYVEITVKRESMSEEDEFILKREIEDALYRFGAITQFKFKVEVKP